MAIRGSDNGIGIGPDHIRSSFDHFPQGGHPAHRAKDGLGLGWSQARTLVRLHDGTLSAASEGKGRGSSFTVELAAL